MQSSNVLRRAALAAAGLAVAMAVASCGGNDNGSSTPPPAATATNTPPASAAASPDGFIAYLKTVVAVQLDTSQPLDVSAFVAPVSDFTQPDPSI